MGIQGLLPLLSSIQKCAHLKDFAGQRLGIDAYGWLHRGTFTCAIELAQDKPCRAYVDFALSRVRMLQHFGVTPYLVFDGGRLPSKAHTEKERSERRKEGRRKGLAYLEAGKSSLAYQELQKSIDVTPQMARNLIEELKTAGIEYIVAPYEADSQLVYLESRGVINGILSEDSDLLVFGANVLITKLDQYGECVVYRKSDFTKCKEISLVNWSNAEFRMMAILSGCDYLTGIQGVGLKSAYRLVRQHKSIEKIVRMLQFDGKKKMPTNYLQAFHDADRTFLHQWVYCPEAKCLVNLNPLPQGLGVEDMPYIGTETAAELATSVATGDRHPSSKEPLYSTLRTTTWKKTSRPHSTVQQTPDLKEGRSIAEFFKPVRTPLAELDPNSFTPSPSQQRLLAAQQGRSWSAQGTPSVQRRTDSIRAAMKAATPSTTVKGSIAQASKSGKQRLCLNSASLIGEAALESPYFAQKPNSKLSKKVDDFELLSDDSICDALESTSQAVETELLASQKSAESHPPNKRKRFDVFVDGAEKRRSFSTLTASAVPSTQTSSFSSMLRSQSSTTTNTISTSLSSLFSLDSHNAATEEDVAAQKLELHSKQWLYDLKMPVKQTGAAKEMVDVVESSKQALISGRVCTQENEASSTYNSIPRSSPSRSEVSLDRDARAEEPPKQASTIRESAAQDLGAGAYALPPNKAEKCPAGLLGSEDFMIPQSPGSVDEEDNRTRPKLSLDIFAFVG